MILIYIYMWLYYTCTSAFKKASRAYSNASKICSDERIRAPFVLGAKSHAMLPTEINLADNHRGGAGADFR